MGRVVNEDQGPTLALTDGIAQPPLDAVEGLLRVSLRSPCISKGDDVMFRALTFFEGYILGTWRSQLDIPMVRKTPPQSGVEPL